MFTVILIIVEALDTIRKFIDKAFYKSMAAHI